MSASRKLVVGTRDSKLARLQTDMAIECLKKHFPELSFEIIAVKTSGDKVLNKPLAELGSRGVFVKELEEALLLDQVDLVVHSLKDLPTMMPDGLCLAATIERCDPRDVLVSTRAVKFMDLQAGSRVATSSRRRTAQLRALRDDLEFVDIRGNIQTRMRKLEEGQCEAMVLAAAGLIRLELTDRIVQYFQPEESTPAVGQGALALECRKSDKEVCDLVMQINDPKVWACTQAERAFLNKLGGGCSVPVGALACMLNESEFELSGCVTSIDGKEIFKDRISGRLQEDASIASITGIALADRLLERGAGRIVEDLLGEPLRSVWPP